LIPLLPQLASKVAEAIPAIKEGSTIPSGYAIKEDNPEQATVDLGKLAGKNLIIGVPGAFTPPCSSHVPGYVGSYDKFSSKGIKDIYIVAVNDAFATQAWKEKLESKQPNVHFLADDTGAFTNAVGLGFDATGLLGNARSQRYVAVVENNTVSQLFVEQAAPDVKVTAADHVLSQLK
jgi:2-Cys peroxiredoxin 5